MKKQWKVGRLVPASIIALMLCGCATENAIPDLSESEMQMVEEYAARLLLKYDANYIPTTMSDAQIEEERIAFENRAAVQQQIAQERAEREASRAEEASSEESGSGRGGSSEPSTPVYADIDDFFGLDGFEINYAGYLICDSYPTETVENDWQGIARATAGNKLIVFSYTVQNQSGEARTVDMTQHRARFNFKIRSGAGDVSKSSLTTLLLSDLGVYRETLEAGETGTAVLLIEVTQEVAESLSGVTMVLREGDARAELTLL